MAAFALQGPHPGWQSTGKIPYSFAKNTRQNGQGLIE
jgi:hypothetical protein